MEPPAKKLRPYVTKFQRRKAQEIEVKSVHEVPNTNHNDNELNDVKELFVTDETVLEYDDRTYRSLLPRFGFKLNKMLQSFLLCY